MQGTMNPSGRLGMRVTRARSARSWNPFERGLPWEVRRWRLRNLHRLIRPAVKIAVAKVMRSPIFYGSLYITILRADGTRVPLGLASLRVVTTAGVNAIVDAFQNTVEIENFKYHGIGTGNTAEAVGDTALVTELTTEYVSDNTRATGTTAEGATANIYQTVGTNEVDGAAAIVEHGIFTQAATGGGTLLDRTVFSAVNLGSGDSIQTTYELTLTAGS